MQSPCNRHCATRTDDREGQLTPTSGMPRMDALIRLARGGRKLAIIEHQDDLGSVRRKFARSPQWLYLEAMEQWIGQSSRQVPPTRVREVRPSRGAQSPISVIFMIRVRRANP